MWWWSAIKAMFKPKPYHSAVEAAIKLLRDEPDQWSKGSAWWTHSSGMKIWSSSYVWALTISLPGHGEIFSRASGCTATRSHKALHKAMKESGSAGSEAISNYMRTCEIKADERRLKQISDLVDQDIKHMRLKHGDIVDAPYKEAEWIIDTKPVWPKYNTIRR